MRLTIIADDGSIGIDGEFFIGLDLSQLDPAIHAVQWHGTYGEVEYKPHFEDGALVKPANMLITDVTPFQFAIGIWGIVKAIVDEQAQAEAEAIAQAAAQTLVEEPDPQ